MLVLAFLLSLDVTSSGTVINSPGWNHVLQVAGAVTNAGTIADGAHPVRLAALDDIDNQGVVTCAEVVIAGTDDQRVGIAAQDTLSNTIAGFTILWDKPFVVGDRVSVAGEYGMVQDITLRSTRIRTPRNSYVVIPSKRIIDEVLENDSKHGELRIDVPIGIAYKEDTVAAREALMAAVATVPDILVEPAPTVVVEACADSSVNLLVRVWIEQASARQRVNFDVMEACTRSLDAAGIQIPFPHLQLFWDDVEARVVDKLRPLAG